MPTALVLINTNSARAHEGERACDALVAEGWRLRRHAPRDPEQMRRLIEAEGPGADLVVVGGGDGTLNGALPAVLATGATLAVLPLGTANDFARSLSLPLDPPAALTEALQGSPREVDVAMVDGRPFLNAVQIGVGVNVNRHLAGVDKRQWGVLGYARAGWKALRRMRAFKVRLTCDGTERHLKATHITVGNGRYYGGGMVVAEDAAIDDGQLDIYSVRADSALRWLPLLPALRVGYHPRGVFHARARRVSIETRPARTVTADGEPIGRTPVTIQVVPGALRVLAGANNAR